MKALDFMQRQIQLEAEVVRLVLCFQQLFQYVVLFSVSEFG